MAAPTRLCNEPNFPLQYFTWLRPVETINLHDDIQQRFKYQYSSNTSKWTNKVAYSLLKDQQLNAQIKTFLLKRYILVPGTVILSACMLKLYLTAAGVSAVALGTFGFGLLAIALYTLRYPKYVEKIRLAYAEEVTKAQQYIDALKPKQDDPTILYTLDCIKV